MKPAHYAFQTLIKDKGVSLYRDLPWRRTTNPYHIFLSEVMLQQTQVTRAESYYRAFLRKFPTVNSLAKSNFYEILGLWSGLGYNRRAKWLHESAKSLASSSYNELRDVYSYEALVALRGVGPNTAAAIRVYAFQDPLPFIETNIRTVYIYHFFSKTSQNVTDKKILRLVKATLDTSHPREWYWALMDYGSWLKKEYGNFSKRSSHYKKQSAFSGSLRQIRGMILRFMIADRNSAISSSPHSTVQKFIATSVLTKDTHNKVQIAFQQLCDEGFITKVSQDKFILSDS